VAQMTSGTGVTCRWLTALKQQGNKEQATMEKFGSLRDLRPSSLRMECDDVAQSDRRTGRPKCGL